MTRWLEEYFNKILFYLRDKIIDLPESDTWNTQLTIAINFVSSKGAEEERVMHSESDNIKFASYNDANKVADELFESLGSRYQGDLETPMAGSEFIFDSVIFVFSYIYIWMRRGGSYISSPEWTKKKKSNNESER